MDCPSFIKKYDNILSPGAPEELNNNYKKLYKKLHPDRNYGREHEVVEDFKALMNCKDEMNDHYTRLARSRQAPPPQAARAPSPPRQRQEEKDEKESELDCNSIIRKHDSALAPGSPERLERNLRKLKGRLHPDKNQGRDVEYREVDQCESAIRSHYSRPASSRSQAARAASPVRAARAPDVEELRRREAEIREQVERERARRQAERAEREERESERRQQEFARQQAEREREAEERLRNLEREREEQRMFERERQQRERREAEIRAEAIARRDAETRARIMRGQYTEEERLERMLRQQRVARRSPIRSRSPIRAPIRSQSPIRLGEFPGVQRPVRERSRSRSPRRDRSPPRRGFMSRLSSYLWPENDIVWEDRVGPMPYNAPAGWIDAQGREHRYRM